MAKQSRMVPPVNVDISIEKGKTAGEPEKNESPKRKTAHGIVCMCGSENVKVTTTEWLDSDRKYPEFLAVRPRRKRQYFECEACGRKGSRVVEVTEKVVRTDQK